MRVLKFIMPPDCGGMTIKDFAKSRLRFSTRVLAGQKRMENGVLKNGIPCRVTEKILPEDELSFCLPEEEGNYAASPAELSILFENEDYLAVDKQPFMPVHPSPGHDFDSLLNAVAYHYRETGQSCLFRPLYRLDRDTSGVIIIGKHRAAVSAARIEKRYFAVCEGVFQGSGTIELPIGLAPGSKILRECGHGDFAVTHWRALASGENHTLAVFRLGTGRTHQIRVHMARMGYPVAGDDLYGGSRARIGRQALHCGTVRISAPAFQMEQTISADLPADLRAAFPWLPGLETIQKEEWSCQPV